MKLSTTRSRLALVAGSLIAATASCRAQPMRPAELSESAVVLALPAVEQDDSYGCGVATLAALCEYWNVALPGDLRAELARTADAEQGLSGGELRTVLEGLGMEVFVFRGTLDRTVTGLYRHVDAGRPPLVMLSPDGRAHHYCLVLGYDEPRATVILLDPAQGAVSLPAAAFERGWGRCERFTLLATPASELAADGTRVAATATAPTPNPEK